MIPGPSKRLDDVWHLKQDWGPLDPSFATPDLGAVLREVFRVTATCCRHFLGLQYVFVCVLSHRFEHVIAAIEVIESDQTVVDKSG